MADQIVSVLYSDMEDQLKGVYGGIYIDAAAAEMTTIGTDFSQVVNGWDGNFAALNTVPAFGSNQITLSKAGKYRVHCDVSFARTTAGGGGGSTTTIELALAVDGTVNTDGAAMRSINSTSVGSTSFTNYITVTAGQVLSLRIRSSNGGDGITIQRCCFTAERIGL